MNAWLVAVGVGNTTIKVGVAAESATEELPQWVQRVEVPTGVFQPPLLAELLPQGTSQWLVASVQREAEGRLREWVSGQRPGDAYRRLSDRDMPLVIDVESPERVGLDRLAAAVAANRLRQRTGPRWWSTPAPQLR
jgi:type III pantothenate kinase